MPHYFECFLILQGFSWCLVLVLFAGLLYYFVHFAPVLSSFCGVHLTQSMVVLYSTTSKIFCEWRWINYLQSLLKYYNRVGNLSLDFSRIFLLNVTCSYKDQMFVRLREDQIFFLVESVIGAMFAMDILLSAKLNKSHLGDFCHPILIYLLSFLLWSFLSPVIISMSFSVMWSVVNIYTSMMCSYNV